MKTKSARWDQTKSLFEAALQREPGSRVQFLKLNCADTAIQKQVFRLLSLHMEMGSFLSGDGHRLGAGALAAEAPPAFVSGQFLANRFTIIRYIARGGMGEVYEALDGELDSPVAIKSIRADMLNDRLLRQFKEEVQLAKQVTHPNICRVYDLFRHDSAGSPSTFLISMELLQGETLAQHLQQVSRLSGSEALPIALQVASALGAAHDAGIMHRDLKPENVMLVPADGVTRAVVMDFGVALRVRDSWDDSPSTTVIGGTPAYMSPEQLDDRELTPASDIYSLGLLMYRMITGQHAFHASVTSLEALARFTESITPPRQLVPELDRRWETTILTCVERDPARRYPSAHSVAAALRGEEDRSHKDPRIRIYVSVAAALCACILLFYFYLGSTTRNFATSGAHPLLLKGLAALESGDPLAAKPVLESEVLKEPNFAPAHAALSAALSPLGYDKRAKDEATTSMSLTSGLSREDVLFVKGVYYESTASWQEAAKTFETLHAIAPEKAEWALRYAYALAKSGKQKDAFEVIAKLRSAGISGKPSVRMDLVEAAVAENDNDYEREVKAGARAEKSASAAGLTYQAAHAEMYQAWAFDNLSKFAEAESKAAKAKTLLMGIGDEGGMGHAWKLLGDIYADEDHFEPAISAYQQAASVFRKVGWQAGECVALNNLAYVLVSRGDLQEARNLFGQSLSISRASGDLKLQSLALNGAAIVLRNMGNSGGAEEVYLECIEIAKHLADDGNLATMLNNLAVVQQDDGKLPEAKETFESAMKLFQKLGRRSDISMALGNLGDVEIQAGNLAVAEKRLRQGIDLAKAIPSQKQLGYDLLGLGELYFIEGAWKRARAYEEEAARIRKTLGEAGTLAETSLALAEVDLVEKRFKQAVIRAQSAELEFANQKKKDLQAFAQSILAESFLGQQRLAQALSLADSAMKILASSEDKSVQIEARLHVWKVYEAAGRRPEALHILKSVVADAERFSHLPELLQARFFIAQLEMKSSVPGANAEMQYVRKLAKSKGFVLIG